MFSSPIKRHFHLLPSLLDSIIHLLIVWYYCTLTIRERILMQNGSRIKGWWAMYHFILTAEAAVMLIWYVVEPFDNHSIDAFLCIHRVSLERCCIMFFVNSLFHTNDLFLNCLMAVGWGSARITRLFKVKLIAVFGQCCTTLSTLFVCQSL